MKIQQFVSKVYNHIFNDLVRMGLFDRMSDENYIKMQYKIKTHKELNLENPKSFNEKIQWLKLYYRNPKYIKMLDKYEAKKYVGDIIGQEYIIPTLGVYEKFDEIDFETLPNQFVIKCTHDSGGVIICKDKEILNIKQAKKKIEKSLARNYFYNGREWLYKNIKPRIIIEKYMVDESEIELKDYKIFCFNGTPKFIQVDFGRFSNHRRNIYSLDWEILNLGILYPNDVNEIIKKPKNLNKMIEIAKILSKGIPHVRVDLYSIDNNIYFGELTFYHGSGYEKFTPEEWNYKFGEYIELPDKYISDNERGKNE